MKLPPWSSLVLLLLQLSCADVRKVSAQGNGTELVPPQRMRLCLPNPGCSTLTFTGDYYEARLEGQTAKWANFWLKAWTVEGVELYGKTVAAADGVFPAEGTFTARISPAGNSVTGGRDDWRVGYSQSGTMPFTLTWTKTIAKTDTPSTATKRSEQQVPNQARASDVNSDTLARAHRSKTHPNILLPPGASEEYASFPDDVRAILQPEYPLTYGDAMRPCDDQKRAADPSVTDLNVALEIGRYALRAGDYARGRCWVNRSAEFKHTPRNMVLLGVIHLMGWVGPKNPELAFRFFIGELQTKDFWAENFAEECYEHGIGTPVNKEQATYITSALMFATDADRLQESIGADDLEWKRQQEREGWLTNPPKKVTYCPENPKYDNYGKLQPQSACTYEIDQAELQRHLDAIDAKYGAIK